MLRKQLTFGTSQAKQIFHNSMFSHETQRQMLLLLEIRCFIHIRKGSDGISIAIITFRMLVLAGALEVI